jgi:hypothetical protein
MKRKKLFLLIAIVAVLPFMSCEAVQSIQSKIDPIKNTYAYNLEKNNLYVAYIIDGAEFLFWFKKCMANELFTFYKVGYRTVERLLPSVEGINSDSNIIFFNITSSDNIGPFKMSNGGWTGGNHTYNGSIKTAKTESYSVFVDGKTLNEDAFGIGNNVCIHVTNIIYDPAIASVSSGGILSTVLCTESIVYTIVKNNIEVVVSHRFSSSTTNTIETYYGMQSMFVSENYLITPNGKYNDWISAVNLKGSFTKRQYPSFNRFIEKNSTFNTFQSTYIQPRYELGKHEEILDDEPIFIRNNEKGYHFIIGSNTLLPLAGKVIKWKGTYTFFNTAIIDNSGVFAYRGTIDGLDALFINTKKNFNGSIPIPYDLESQTIKVKECIGITNEKGTQNFIVEGRLLSINSESSGSLILIFSDSSSEK